MSRLRQIAWRLLGSLAPAYRALPPRLRTPIRRLALRVWLAWVQGPGREIIVLPCPELGGPIALPIADVPPLTLVYRNFRGKKPEPSAPNITLGPAEVFVDVGAYVGWWSLLLSMKAPTARIVAIEPLPIHLACLEQNVRAFGAKNVIIIPKAASDREGEAELIYLGPSSAIRRPILDTALAQGGHEPGERARIRVPTVTLDRALAELGIGEVHLMKINVEGAELEVLEGARRTIERSGRLRLVVGVHPWCIALSDVTDLLAGFGFQCRVIGSEDHPVVIAERAG